VALKFLLSDLLFVDPQFIRIRLLLVPLDLDFPQALLFLLDADFFNALTLFHRRLVLSFPFLSLGLVVLDSGLSFLLPFVVFASLSPGSFIDFFLEVLLVPNPPDSFFLKSCLFDGLTLNSLPLLGLSACFFFAGTLLCVLDLADANLFFMQSLDALFVLVALACDSLLILEPSPPLFFLSLVVLFLLRAVPLVGGLCVAIDQFGVPGVPLVVPVSSLVLVVLVLLVFLILVPYLVDPAGVSLGLNIFARSLLLFIFIFLVAGSRLFFLFIASSRLFVFNFLCISVLLDWVEVGVDVHLILVLWSAFDDFDLFFSDVSFSNLLLQLSRLFI